MNYLFKFGCRIRAREMRLIASDSEQLGNHASRQEANTPGAEDMVGLILVAPESGKPP